MANKPSNEAGMKYLSITTIQYKSIVYEDIIITIINKLKLP